LTNPHIFLPGHPKTWERNPVTNKFLHIDEEATKKLRNRPILSNEDIALMLKKADVFKDDYTRLRLKCLVALLKKFGKRRNELAKLKIIQLIINGNYLEITFTISKKHKRGLFQYFKFVKDQIVKGKLPANYLDNKLILN
jgi:site-specific recombinase XerD